jgi:hypothetical protein
VGLTCSPPGDHDGEHAGPDGEQGDDDVQGGSQRSHDVRPHARAVHDLHEQAQLALRQRAVLGEHDLEVALCNTYVHTPSAMT